MMLRHDEVLSGRQHQHPCRDMLVQTVWKKPNHIVIDFTFFKLLQKFGSCFFSAKIIYAPLNHCKSLQIVMRRQGVRTNNGQYTYLGFFRALKLAKATLMLSLARIAIRIANISTPNKNNLICQFLSCLSYVLVTSSQQNVLQSYKY